MNLNSPRKEITAWHFQIFQNIHFHVVKWNFDSDPLLGTTRFSLWAPRKQSRQNEAMMVKNKAQVKKKMLILLFKDDFKSRAGKCLWEWLFLPTRTIRIYSKILYNLIHRSLEYDWNITTLYASGCDISLTACFNPSILLYVLLRQGPPRPHYVDSTSDMSGIFLFFSTSITAVRSSGYSLVSQILSGNPQQRSFQYSKNVMNRKDWLC